MRRSDLNGIAVGLVIGVPMTIYKNPGNTLSGHMAYVLGVVLFCWAANRLVSVVSKRR